MKEEDGMTSNQIVDWAKKLSARGFAEQLKNGREAISVSLMLPGRITVKSRSERIEILKKEFENKLQDLAGVPNVEFNFNSISPSAQTIQAKLDIEYLEPLINIFKEKGVEVYPNTSYSLE